MYRLLFLLNLRNHKQATSCVHKTKSTDGSLYRHTRCNHEKQTPTAETGYFHLRHFASPSKLNPISTEGILKNNLTLWEIGFSCGGLYEMIDTTLVSVQ